MATVLDTAPTLFGAYIISVSTTLSWGSQGASTQFKVVEDPENGVIINVPPIGSPVIFPGTNQTLGSFSYENPLASGILQRATYSESLSGRTYDIVIQSPATILSGVQVILNKFNGDGSGGRLSDNIGVNNILNVYGHFENYFAGGYGAGFGDSAVDDLGFALKTTNTDGEIVDLIQTIGDMTGDVGFSQFGNPIRHGTFAYALDLSALYNAIGVRNLWYYRISGDVIDLGTLISQICDLMQFDWMIQLEDRNGPFPVLNIKLMDRSQTPVPGVISGFVKSVRDSGKLISSNYGEELSSGMTAKVVSGAPVSRFYESAVSSALPIWGRAGEEMWNVHPQIGQTVASVYTTANLENKNYNFTTMLPGYGQWKVTLFELRMLTGDAPKESWQLFKTFQSIANVEPNGYNGEDGLERAPWYSKTQINLEQLQTLAKGERLPKQDLQQTSISESEKRQDEEREKFLDQLISGLQNVADSFCRNFMMPVPSDDGGYDENVRWVNTYGNSSIKRYQYAWDVVADAWSNNPKVGRGDFFNNGRIKAMAGFSGSSVGAWGYTVNPIDYSDLGDSAASSGGSVYTLGGSPLEQEMYNLYGTWYVPCAVDTNPLVVDDWATPYFGISSLAKYFFDVDIPPTLYATPNSSDFIYEVPRLRALPFMFGIPQQSNKYRWGPWIKVADDTNPTYTAGSTQVEFDDSLAPETFGGMVGLDQAGFATANIDIGQVGVSETGMIELVGTPELNIGEQFQQGGPYVSDLDVAVGTDGIKHTYKFNTWTPRFGKLAKHNIELLSRIGTSSFSNSNATAVGYSTPVTGGTFGMSNASTRQIAKNISRADKNSRNYRDKKRVGDETKSNQLEFTISKKKPKDPIPGTTPTPGTPTPTPTPGTPTPSTPTATPASADTPSPTPSPTPYVSPTPTPSSGY